MIDGLGIELMQCGIRVENYVKAYRRKVADAENGDAMMQ